MIHFNIILPSMLNSSEGLFSSPIRAAPPARFILLHSIIFIIFEEGATFWSSSLCSFLQSSVTSFLLGWNNKERRGIMVDKVVVFYFSCYTMDFRV
jgi:hypothetical protein